MPKVNRKSTKAERMQRFARYREAGVPIGDAIRLALSPDPSDRDVTKGAIPSFAARHGLDPKNTAAAIYGNRSATADLCSALVEEIGESADFWKGLLSPTREAAASA
jgi:hypothetical protein